MGAQASCMTVLSSSPLELGSARRHIEGVVMESSHPG